MIGWALLYIVGFAYTLAILLDDTTEPVLSTGRKRLAPFLACLWPIMLALVTVDIYARNMRGGDR